MFCHKCGSNLANDATFCSRCGARTPSEPNAAAPAQNAPVPSAPPSQVPPVYAAAPPQAYAPPMQQGGGPMGIAGAVPPAYPGAQPAPGTIAAEAHVASRAGTVAADPRLEREVWTGRFSSKALAQWYLALGAWTIVAIVLAAKVGGPWLLWFTLIVGPALAVVGKLLYLKWTIKYRLTTQRFFHTYGFAVQRTDEVELLRIDDVTLEQTLLERVFNVGTLVIESTDKSEPKKLIKGIARPLEVKEFVRSYALQLRQGQNVMRVHSM